jgi:hypothetical protein
MVHQRDELETRVVGGPGHGGQVSAEAGRSPGMREIRDLQSNPHAITSGPSLS